MQQGRHLVFVICGVMASVRNIGQITMGMPVISDFFGNRRIRGRMGRNHDDGRDQQRYGHGQHDCCVESLSQIAAKPPAHPIYCPSPCPALEYALFHPPMGDTYLI